MTTTAIYTRRVPVRTWREKAILGETFARSAAMRAAEFGDNPGMLDEIWLTDEIHAGDCLDTKIDNYAAQRDRFLTADTLLLALRRMSPGPGAALEIPPGFDILGELDHTIQGLEETTVADLVDPRCSQRDIAEATTTAYALRDEITGGAS